MKKVLLGKRESCRRSCLPPILSFSDIEVIRASALITQDILCSRVLYAKPALELWHTVVRTLLSIQGKDHTKDFVLLRSKDKTHTRFCVTLSSIPPCISLFLSFSLFIQFSLAIWFGLRSIKWFNHYILIKEIFFKR